MTGSKVLLVDVDPQGNLTSGVGSKSQRAEAGTVYEALLTDMRRRPRTCWPRESRTSRCCPRTATSPAPKSRWSRCRSESIA